MTTDTNLHLSLIPLLALTGAAINGFFGKKFSKQVVSAVALAFCGAAFAWALVVVSRFSSLNVTHIEEPLTQWIRISGFSVDFGFYLDHLSLIMLMVVTGVGFLIHI